MLNLQKIDYIKYERKEYKKTEYDDLKQNISRSWRFLKDTHRLKSGECLCLRALATKTNDWDEWCVPKELVIFNYDSESYKEFEKFITSKVNSKRIYNFYYNIYNINIRRVKETLREKEKGFFGNSCNVGSTSILICDFDDFTQNDYIKMKEDFKERGLNGTIDIMTGHGYHIVFRLKENSEDEYLLLRFIKILQANGYNPDIQCQDCARIMRLPFFFNQKPKKYNTVSLSEITDGEYSSRLFTVDEIFQAFGFDYNTFNLDDYYNKKKTERKKTVKRTETEVTCNKDVNLYELFDFLNIDELPVGIKNMLKGFRKGYTNLQTYCLTIFFKRKGYDLETIKQILETVESINGNSWNNKSASDEAERFFETYSYMNKYTLKELESIFGEIVMTYNEQMYKIPVNVMKPVEMKLYTYLLLNNDSKKKDIIESLKISNNTVDKIVKESIFITVDNRLYNVNKDAEIKNFIYVNYEFLNRILSLSSNEFSVFCYLYHRIGIKKEVRTSIQSIKNNCFISEKTITNTIKELEEHKIIKVLRSKYNYVQSKKESNLYKII